MARALQRTRFYTYYWPRWFFKLPYIAFSLLLCRLTRLGGYRGIRISSFTLSHISGEEFTGRTIEALQLVERTDPVRFRRIQRQIRFIVHAELRSGACYQRLGRFCFIDFTRYDFSKDHDWYLYSYASTLVHEATHGAVYSDYVAYTKRNRLRIEKLCHTEERRFLQNLDVPERAWSEQIAGAFDEQYFLKYFSSNWRSRSRIIKTRISEVRRDA